MNRYEIELTDEQAQVIAEARPEPLRDVADTPWWTGIYALADAIRANPPRMDEPGWGEKVIAHTCGNPERRRFVRWAMRPNLRWVDDSSEHMTRRWTDLIDPEPVS